MVNHVILVGYTINPYHESPKMSPLKGDFASLNQIVSSAWTGTSLKISPSLIVFQLKMRCTWSLTWWLLGRLSCSVQ